MNLFAITLIQWYCSLRLENSHWNCTLLSHKYFFLWIPPGVYWKLPHLPCSGTFYCKLLVCPLHYVLNYFLLLYSWRKYLICFSNDVIHILVRRLGKQRVTVTVTSPPHLWSQISQLLLQVVWQTWNERSLVCMAGRAAGCSVLGFRNTVHSGFCY